MLFKVIMLEQRDRPFDSVESSRKCEDGGGRGGFNNFTCLFERDEGKMHRALAERETGLEAYIPEPKNTHRLQFCDLVS